MKCLYCNKVIKDNEINEITHQWHTKCIKTFFGSKVMPTIDCNLHTITENIKEFNPGVCGVQKKLSLHLDTNKETRLTLIGYPAGYILKPQSDEYNKLPELEFLSMLMAKETGIKVVPFALIKVDNEIAYITKRIDRDIQNNKIIKYAMEDFCQLENKLTTNKYLGSYERCGEVINKYSSISSIDKTEFLLLIIFCFVIGNSDMHLKNFSLIENEKGEFVLSKAYDLLSTNLVIPSDKEELALTINSKKSNFKIKEFKLLAKSLDINDKVLISLIKKVIDKKDKYIEMIDDSYLDESQKHDFKQIILTRIERLC